MRLEDIDRVKKLISQSNILSSVERAEWLQLLPEMTDRQTLQLISILSANLERPVFSPTATPSRPISRAAPQKLQSILRQKEIATSVPFYEPEIAAPNHYRVTQQSAQPISPAQPAPPPAVLTDPQELQKKVESIVREMDQRKNISQAQEAALKNPLDLAPPLASVDLQSYLEQDLGSAAKSKIASRSPGISQKSAPDPQAAAFRQQAKPFSQLVSKEDIAGLHPEFLADRDPGEATESIYQAIVALSQKAPVYSIVAAYEHSPLYQAYVNLGELLLNDPDQNRLRAYDAAEKALGRQGKPALSKEQFEYLTDLRARLGDLY